MLSYFSGFKVSAVVALEAISSLYHRLNVLASWMCGSS